MSRVLIVEDDVLFREYLKDNLESAGFIVHTASTGQEAVKSARRLKPEAIVLDLGLPGMNGRDVIKTLKSDAHTCGIVIIVLTGQADTGKELVCLEDGADNYLVKSSHDVSAVPIYIKKALRHGDFPDNQASIGPVRINMASRVVTVDGQVVRGLHPLEFNLLAFLMQKSPKVVTWDVLEKEIWQIPKHCIQKDATSSIRKHFAELRRKLGPAGAAWLYTNKGIGAQYISPDPKSAK